ncbi:TonB-dependent receptor domain-containing protein [Rhodonellum sp.]|uniref:TonB-dependent receptor domain-containing protein n=1 Tax=Rhodonellum sp. TaxID=2231180 RepID=UPI00271D6B9A|nr:TonB-dependent receptor [Rhodonellum sp.]MDO9554246.1 TonB-dependent receptor [Rhodonellum sp.]
MNIKNILLVALLLLTSEIHGQRAEQNIRLLDADNAMPIIGATFEYEQQKGVSDENGTIAFVFKSGQSMRLSHIIYGVWTLDDAQVQKAVENQVYYRKSRTVNLHPVTIIAMKTRLHSEELVSLEYEERMAHDAATILNQIPAFNSIRKSGNYGFDPVFRGFKYDQLNVVLNGAQSATTACPNRMDPPTSQMAPNMMDRIEILKGPYSLRYGTGFGATINFIPAKLRFTATPEMYGRVSLGYESNGNIPRGEAQIGFSGDQFDLSLFGSWSQGDDYKAGNGETVQADFKRGSFGANLGIKLSSNQQLRLSAINNQARDADFPALPMDLRIDDTWMFNARHDIQFDKAKLKSWNTTVFGSFVDHLMDNQLKPINPRTINTSTRAETYNYGGRTEGIWKFANGDLYAGADLRVEGAEGIRIREFLTGPMAGKTFEDNAWQQGRISKTGIFGEYQLMSDNFSYVFSARLEMNQSNINDPSVEFTNVYAKTQEIQINPNFSLGILKPIGESIQTGLWLGRAQRSGSLTERFINYFPVGQDPYEMIGNPQLNPEVNNQVDLTFVWSKGKSAINVDLFAAYLQDYISSVIDSTLSPRLPASPGVRRFINIKDAYKTGFEVRWTQQLPIGLQQTLALAYTYAQDLDRNEPLPEIAPLDLRYVLSGSYLQNKLKPEASLRYVTRQGRISQEFGETKTPSFSLLDVKIGYSFTDQFIGKVGINNLFNENYYEHLNRSVRGTNSPIFAPGRNFLVNVSFLF